MNTKTETKRAREAKERQVSHDLAIAYHMAKGLTELLARVKANTAYLPERERYEVVRAAGGASTAYSSLNCIIIDRGNENGAQDGHG